MDEPRAAAILKFVIFIAYLAHWTGCVFYFVAAENLDTGTVTWIDEQGLRDAEFGDLYVTAFYFSLTTLTTIGYGDVVPVSIAERVVAVFAMIVGSCVFAYGITTIITLVQNINKASAEYKTRMDEINAYMRARSLPKELRSDIRSYLHWNFAQEQAQNAFLSEKRILSLMTPSLRTRVVLYVNEQILENVNVFTIDNAMDNPKFTMAIVSALEQEFYAPDEYVVREGDFGDKIFILCKGEAEELKFGSIRINVLSEGSHFGEVCLIDEHEKRKMLEVLVLMKVQEKNKRECNPKAQNP